MNRYSIWLCCLVFVYMFFHVSDADAFVLPQNANVGPGSEWVYSSNLGTARSRILAREHVDGHWQFRWQLAVAGLTYEEGLRLTDDTLSVMDREFTAFLVYRDYYVFPEDELTLQLPLKVGSSWKWQGLVTHGKEVGADHISGRVVQKTSISVPAGSFEVFEIELRRTDDFGTVQNITLWFNEEIGVVKATGQLHWQGFVGRMQDMVGFNNFTVELRSYEIVNPK